MITTSRLEIDNIIRETFTAKSNTSLSTDDIIAAQREGFLHGAIRVETDRGYDSFYGKVVSELQDFDFSQFCNVLVQIEGCSLSMNQLREICGELPKNAKLGIKTRKSFPERKYRMTLLLFIDDL